MYLKVELKNLQNKLSILFSFLPNESLRLSFDDNDDGGLWLVPIDRGGSSKTSLLCNGGRRFCWKRWAILVFNFILTGRGGIGGGVDGIVSDKAFTLRVFSLFIGRAMASVCKFWTFGFASNFC